MKRLVLSALASVTLVAACQQPGPPKGAEPAKSSDKGEPSGSSEDDGAASLGMGGLAKFGPLGSMLAAKLDEPGPYDAPRRSPGFKKDAPHWLAMNLDGEVTELKQVSLMGGGGSTIELQPFVARLREAAADPNVRGLLVRVKDLAVDWSAADELRAALVEFKGSGQRTLACHADNLVDVHYYVLSACDRLGLSPHGMVTIAGAAATPIHLKGLLDRLGVVPDFVHVGAFKGAAEPLTRTAPSKEMVETLDAIVARYHASLRAGLVDGRRLDDAAAGAAIDRALFTGESAKSAGLVDSVGVWEEFRAETLAGAEWTVWKSKEGAMGALDFSKLQVFLGLMPPKRPKEKHVALVYALGNVIDGDGEGILGARQEIAGHTLSTALRQMADDEAIAAIVLRVNSGGGSAIASEQIFQAVAAAKAKKPVVVSMGRVAASGGYYISTGASKIYATPETLTGSIGVVGGKVALGGALKKMGVDTYHVGRGKRSALWSLMTPWTADERADVLAMMEETYKVFVDRVAKSRGKSYDEIHAIAQGRVWTGEDAKARGLIDSLGGLEDALADARTLGGVDPKTDLEIYPPEPTLKDLLQTLGPIALPVGLRGALAEIEAEAGPRTARQIEGALRSLLLLRTHHVLTIDWTPGLLGE